MMLKYRFIFFFGLILLFASCSKEIEVTPANIYGTWSHQYQSDNYFQGMRFHENGDFQYLERFNYEKFRESDIGEGALTYILEDKTVTIFRNIPGEPEPTVVRSFKIKSLTKGTLTEEDGFVWRWYVEG
ncbi:MAG: hypothetical protein ACXWD4_15610 [Bacteroidia bacterium]